MFPDNNYELKLSTTFTFEEDPKWIEIKEYNDNYAHSIITQYQIRKDKFLFTETLKRLPLKTLKAVKKRIEKEIERRKNE